MDEKISAGHFNMPTELDPVVCDFARIIHSDLKLATLVSSMLREVETVPEDAPLPRVAIKDLDHLLEHINKVLTCAPLWDNAGEGAGLLGCPFNMLFAQMMGTPSGWDFFSRGDVNHGLCRILTVWSEFLTSSASISTLSGENGWCTPTSLEVLATAARNSHKHVNVRPALLRYLSLP